MSRRSWRKKDLYITYGNPSITPFTEVEISSMKDVMYFYYDVSILDGKKTIFETSVYEFPKVQNLPAYIDYILNMKEEDMYLYENLEDGDFKRKKLYSFVELNDSFNFNMEYFYKIEKHITYVKQSNQEEFKRYEEYILTIGQHEKNKEGYDNGEDFGKSVFIKYLTKEDLERLSKTAQEFCKVSIEDYNKELKERKIKCPKCNEVQSYLTSLVNVDDETHDYNFKCSSCNNEFTDDDDIYLD